MNISKFFYCTPADFQAANFHKFLSVYVAPRYAHPFHGKAHSAEIPAPSPASYLRHTHEVHICAAYQAGSSHKCELKQAILVKLLYGTHHSDFFGTVFFLTENVNIFYL